MPFEKLPKWKDENPITHEKQQLKMHLNKLRRDPNTDPNEIKALQERYDILDAPMREKRRQQAIDYFARVKQCRDKGTKV